jgi:prepilin peptidase CpaA
MLETATLLFFPALMVFAAFSDLLTLTIPNRVSIALAVLFFALAIAGGLSAADISWHLASGVLILILGFALFARGWIGGGDAKLAAATAMWLGFDHLGEYALTASLLGGLLSVVILALRHWPVLTTFMNQAWIKRLHDPGTGVPYGIALAFAGLLLYPESAIWLAAAAEH